MFKKNVFRMFGYLQWRIKRGEEENTVEARNPVKFVGFAKFVFILLLCMYIFTFLNSFNTAFYQQSLLQEA